MGLGCSKRKDDAAAPLVVRLSPFRPRRVLSRLGSAPPTPRAGAGGDDPALPANTDPGSLLSLALDAVAATLPQQPARELACLPADLSQLLLERLVAAGRLDDDTVLRLSGLGLHFFRLPLGAYPELVRPFWLRCLASPSLEAADLSKTGVTDDALAALGAPPRLHTLRLDYCVEITDAGLALLQGLPLEDLSLVACEQITAVGLRHLGGLTRLRRLSLQTCHQISNLALLQRLTRLESLDLGYCSNVTDADAAVLERFGRLQELSLARTQVTDAGLAALHMLSNLRTLNVAGLRVSDEALAALLCQLPLLRVLSLERCTEAGDAALGALSKHAPQLRELLLGYTAVTDRGLRQLESLSQLKVLGLENCGVGDAGLEVLTALTRLHSLDLSDTGATNLSMAAVGQLPGLERLNLSFTGVDDRGLRQLKRMTSLRCLNLDSRLFTDAGMVHVARLTSLECLDLFGARISDTGCAAISKLPCLQRLEVCGGGVTEAGASHLGALSSLQHLSLAQNYRLGNGAIQHLLRLNELTALNLSQCRITSNSVVALGCLPKLQTLALYETRVKPFAVDKLLAANPDLEVQGVPPSSALATGTGRALTLP